MSKIGVVAALPAEAACLYSSSINVATPFEIKTDLWLCLSGVGPAAAERSAERLLDCNIDALVSWGIAGALDHGLNAGDLLIATAAITQQHQYTTTTDWVAAVSQYCVAADYRYQQAAIASTTELCASTAAKKMLFQQTGALAVDMESAAIAALAKTYHKDVLIIRAIADKATMTIPEPVINNTNSLGQPQLPDFIFSIVKNPSSIFALMQLAVHYKKALTALKQIAADLTEKDFFYHA